MSRAAGAAEAAAIVERSAVADLVKAETNVLQRIGANNRGNVTLHEKILLRGYMNEVENLNVSTGRGEALFYSGPGNKYRAEAFARHGGITLEATPGGAWLDNQSLFKRLQPDKAIIPWNRLSQRYAQGASGAVNVFIDGASPRGVFTRFELPELYLNPDVTTIIKNGVQPIRIK